jgi:hypothetical protein
MEKHFAFAAMLIAASMMNGSAASAQLGFRMQLFDANNAFISLSDNLETFKSIIGPSYN